MIKINPLSTGENGTIVELFEPIEKKSKEYQSEKDLEKYFIKDLEQLGYTHEKFKDEDALKNNLRIQLEKLNNFSFTDNEWKTFYNDVIANEKDTIVEKTEKIQMHDRFVLNLDKPLNGINFKNIMLIDKENLNNNNIQVINQYVDNSEIKHRYDVTILVNGLPLVHIELKRRGASLKDAFNQIERYQKKSFFNGSGLFNFIQIFVISNGTQTKYYSNTTRKLALDSRQKQVLNPGEKVTLNSFEFTSYWADIKNNRISDLEDFTYYFFPKRVILNILTKYCVFTEEKNLLVMRPYQIAATEKILSRIKVALKNPILLGKYQGKSLGGGYIWHSTGSGKTLTSFKTAQLAKNIDDIDKVMFVVDRKDLDYQTIKEYERFQKGCVTGSRNTNALRQALQSSDPKNKVIVTTIQKLSLLIESNEDKRLGDKKVVLIFDECHRSQHGDWNRKIKNFFKKHIMFGFTGTPIFSENSKDKILKITTESIFGDQLHAYTIADAIADGNVLKFNVQYNTVVKNFDQALPLSQLTKDYYDDPKRIKTIVSYVLDNFDRKTMREAGTFGFNSMFAAQSVKSVQLYYDEFKKQIKERNLNLRIASIYSFEPNDEDLINGSAFLDDIDQDFDIDRLNVSAKNFLAKIIKDYNEQFSTQFSIYGESFENYYKDISTRVKKREVDILLVCNMFLTGFDAPTLNTLWIDKKLDYHNLIQAYSRTNRIYNSSKPCGNIIAFRDLEESTINALKLFGNRDVENICLIRTFKEFFEDGYSIFNERTKEEVEYPSYKTSIQELKEKYPLENFENKMNTEKQEADFIDKFGYILRLETILKSFDEFYLEENRIFQNRERQDYQSWYLDLKEKYKIYPEKREKYNIEFEIEILKQNEYDAFTINKLVAEDLLKHKDYSKTLREILMPYIKSNDGLRSKEDLLKGFAQLFQSKIVEGHKPDDINQLWKEYVIEWEEKELKEIIKQNNYKEEKAIAFMKDSFKRGYVKETGIELGEIVGGSIIDFTQNGKIARKEKAYELFQKHFERFSDAYIAKN